MIKVITGTFDYMRKFAVRYSRIGQPRQLLILTNVW